MLENRISLHEHPEAFFFFFSLFKANSDTDVNFNPGLSRADQPGVKVVFYIEIHAKL